MGPSAIFTNLGLILTHSENYRVFVLACKQLGSVLLLRQDVVHPGVYRVRSHPDLGSGCFSSRLGRKL